MSRTQDRFEAMVEKHSSKDDWGIDVINSIHAVVLLRREHAALVRAVRRLERHQAGIYGPFVALKDILALLAKRKGR